MSCFSHLNTTLNKIRYITLHLLIWPALTSYIDTFVTNFPTTHQIENKNNEMYTLFNLVSKTTFILVFHGLEETLIYTFR